MQDSYVTYDASSKTWSLGTSTVEKRLTLSADGRFQLTSFTNKRVTPHAQYISSPTDEFSITVSGTTYTGASGGWVYDSHNITTLAPNGERHLTIVLHNSVLTVTRHYLVYPSTGIIQEWTDFKNTSGGSKNFSSPSIFRQRVANTPANTNFHYMTGGMNFNGSHLLKTVPLTAGYARTFDSHDAPDLEATEPGQTPAKINGYDNQGSSIYHMFYVVENTSTHSGVFLLFDYFGHWANTTSNSAGGLGLNGKVFLANHPVSHNELITSPKSLTGVFQGDIDDMGNDILEYVYTFKWDYTQDRHVGSVKFGHWLLKKPQTENIFHAINNGRYVGADTSWIDGDWYGRQGDWDNLFHDDFQAVNEYSKKHGMDFIVWAPPWTSSPQSKVLLERPEYQVENDEIEYYGLHLDTGKPASRNWQLQTLSDMQSRWGSHVWRYDGQAVWSPKATAQNPQAENPLLGRSHGYLQLLKDFKDANPDAAIFGCSSGGELMSIESTRFSDIQQTTDGAVGHYDGYYSSLFTPIDKMTTGGGWWNDASSNPTPYDASLRGAHSQSFMYQMQVATVNTPTATLEARRKDVERYHYFKSVGVVGRWVKIYRPSVTGSDKTYYLQKMNRDKSRGYITIRPNSSMGSNVTIFPKGLNPTAQYTVSTLEGGRATSTNTGAFWMSNGIGLTALKAGEMVLLNLEDRPGTGSDAIAPSVPANVVKQGKTYLKHAGVELTWTAATDNRWISYYEILKNGTPYTKVSKGTFFFDDLGSVDDTYQVRTVDGDGNQSAAVTAGYTEPGVYTLSKDMSSRQGGHQWSYLEWNGLSYVNMAWQAGSKQWKGHCTNNVIKNDAYIHPDCNDSVIGWTAPQAGTVLVSGKVAKAAAGGDGIDAKIVHKRATGAETTVWPDTGWRTIEGADTVGDSHNITVKVTAGDKLYFQVSDRNNNFFDGANWDPSIQYAAEATQASAAFASTQGVGNWFYREMPTGGGATTNLTWNPTANQWVGSNPYTAIWSPDLMHPGIAADPTQTKDTVREWKAPHGGTIVVGGNVRKSDLGGGDGVRARILKNGTQIWPATSWQIIGGTDKDGATPSLTLPVAANDTISFVLNANSTTYYDSISWDPVISYTSDPPPSTGLPKYGLPADISAQQGLWNWYYRQLSATGFSEMTYQSFNEPNGAVDNHWAGASTYTTIRYPAILHPDGNDAVLTWVAPKTGTVDITGPVRKSFYGVGGDGVRVRIQKNDTTQLWPASGWQPIAGTDTSPGVTPTLSGVAVNQGDSINFIVNRNGDNYFDSTNWEPRITYTALN